MTMKSLHYKKKVIIFEPAVVEDVVKMRAVEHLMALIKSH